MVTKTSGYMANAINLPVFNHYNRDMAAVTLHV